MHVVERRDAAPVFAHLVRVLDVLVLQSRRVEANIVDRGALTDLELQKLVVFLGERLIAGLCDTPRLADVPADIGAAEIISHAGERIPRQDGIRVLIGIHRIEGDPLVRLRVHDLLERCALQQRLAGHLPFLVRRRRELVERHLREVRLALCLLQDRLQIKLAFLLCLFH